MVWYFIGVYIINRTLHGLLETRNFSPCVEKIFCISTRMYNYVISSISILSENSIYYLLFFLILFIYLFIIFCLLLSVYSYNIQLSALLIFLFLKRLFHFAGFTDDYLFKVNAQ